MNVSIVVIFKMESDEAYDEPIAWTPSVKGDVDFCLGGGPRRIDGTRACVGARVEEGGGVGIRAV